jgi:hypothetical protein
VKGERRDQTYDALWHELGRSGECVVRIILESARRMIAWNGGGRRRRCRDFAGRFGGGSGTASIGRAIRARLGRLPGRETGGRVNTFANLAARFCSQTVSTATKPLACHAAVAGLRTVAKPENLDVKSMSYI